MATAKMATGMRRALRLGLVIGPAALAGLCGVARAARAQELDLYGPPPAPSVVHALTPRLLAFGPLFLGHFRDPASDALRNPALIGGRQSGMMVGEGREGSYAVHTMRRQRRSGSEALLVLGPARATAAEIAEPVLLTTNSRVEGRLAMVLGAENRPRVGVSALGGVVPETPARREGGATRGGASGEGWGAVVGWAGRVGRRATGDLAVGWQRGRNVEEVRYTRGDYDQLISLGRSELLRRSGWARLVLSDGRNPGRSLVVTARRRQEDGTPGRLTPTRTPRDPLETFPTPSRIATQTDASVTLGRQVRGGGWSAAVLTGVRLERLTAQAVTVSQVRIVPDTTVWKFAGTTVEPVLGAAIETEPVRGLQLRGSLVLRATRAKETGDQGFGGRQPSGRAERLTFETSTETRIGVGFGPPGGPFRFDFFIPDLTQPGRWTAGASWSR